VTVLVVAALVAPDPFCDDALVTLGVTTSMTDCVADEA
jgi:hypothetical protein